MLTYLINLARRPDRLAAMTRQLDALNIAFSRIDAVDGRDCDPALFEHRFAAKGPLGTLSTGDKACTLSHFRVFEQFLATPTTDDNSHALILEDDVILASEGSRLLRTARWIPSSVGLLKIERFGAPRVLVGPTEAIVEPGHRAIARLLSKHTGAGGYIVSRRVAAELAAYQEKLTLPIDHLLFNPNNSPLFDALSPAQLMPAIVEQTVAVGGATDVHPTRKREQPRGWAYVKRESVRGYYEARLLPQQLAMFASGRARYLKIAVA